MTVAPEPLARYGLWATRCAGRDYAQQLTAAVAITPVLCQTCEKLAPADRSGRCENMLAVRLEDVAVKDRGL